MRCLVLFYLLLACVGTAHAIDGVIDPSFAGIRPGMARVAFDRPDGSLADRAVGAVELADGSVIVVGAVSDNLSATPTVVGLAKLRRDGSLDTSFGGGGKVVFDNKVFYDLFEVLERPATATSAQKILVLASTRIVGGATPRDSVTVVLQFNLDGSADTGFGVGGAVFLGANLPVATPSRQPSHMALQSDGKLLVASTRVFSDVDSDGIVYRLFPNGTLDLPFGGANAGFVEVGFAINADRPGFGSDRVGGIGVTAGGKIVVGFDVQINDASLRTGTLRLSASGQIDTTYGGSGNGRRLLSAVCTLDTDSGSMNMLSLRLRPGSDEAVFTSRVLTGIGASSACLQTVDASGRIASSLLVLPQGVPSSPLKDCVLAVDRFSDYLGCSSNAIGTQGSFDEVLLRHDLRGVDFGSESGNFVALGFDLSGTKDDFAFGLTALRGGRMLVLGSGAASASRPSDQDFTIGRVIVQDAIFASGFGN